MTQKISLPDMSWADNKVISFFWTVSTSANDGPLLMDML